jgi:hypothetical protein
MGRRAPPEFRARRLAAPLFVALGVLLCVEALGGMVLFFARLTWGSRPGEALHVWCGIGLTLVYALYQWRHWSRVAPFRARFDYLLGLLAALSMALVNATGLWLGAVWFLGRSGAAGGSVLLSAPLLTALHDVGSMLVLTFVGAHVGAVLMRDRRAGEPTLQQ